MSTTLLTALIARCRVLGRPRSPTADAELLQRFSQRHDATAFEELLERYASLVWGVCRRILSNESDCEDAFQATFLALVRRPDAIAPSSSLGAWLHTVALRMARKTQARARRERPQTVLPESTTNGDVTDEIGSRELFRLVDEEIERLPESLRLPLILCCLQGRTRDEAAETLACSVSAVKSRLERGRDLLRRRLERRGVQLPVAFLVVGLTAERVRAVLWAKTMQAVLYTPNPAIVALAEAGASALTVGKVKLLLALVLVATTTVGAVGSLLTTTQRQEPPSTIPTEGAAAEPPKNPQPPKVRTDRYGDPLPDGAIARLGTVRWRHGFAVHALAYSADGKMIAAVGKGRAITLWDAVTGKEIHRFPNLSEFLDSVAFSPDGKILATGGSVCRLWNVATGKEVRQLLGGCVAFSPDGKFVATIGTGGTKSDNMLRLWDAFSGKEQWHIDGGTDGVCGLAYSPDGKRIATSARNGVIRMWDSATGKEQTQLKGHKNEVHKLAFSPDGKHLASSSEDETIRLWDVTTSRQTRIVGEKLGVYSSMPIAFSPDGALLASGHIGGVIRLWNLKTGEEKCHWQAGAMAIRAVVFSPDGKTLASGSAYERIRFWDVGTGDERNPSAEHLGMVDLVRITADGAGLISGGWDHRLLWWDLSTQKIRRSFSWPGYGIRSIALSPDGMTLAETDWAFPNKELHLWNTRDGKAGRVLGKAKRRFEGIAFSPNGRLVAAGMLNGDINVWDVRDGKLVRQFKDLRLGTIVALKFSPDSKFLACGFFPATQDRRSLRLWDVENGQEKVEFSCFEEFVAPVAFSPDGKVLASGFNNHDFSGPSLIRLSDTSTGKKRSVYKGHRDSVGEIAFSPDGKLVASSTSGTGHRDNSVHVWEAATGRLIRRFEGHHSCVGSVAFSPNGLTVASGAGDSTILLWDITGRRPDGRWRNKPLTPRQLETCWADLANEDASRAYDAVWALVAAPEQAVPFLRKHLSPIARPDAKAVARWIADLDSEDFAVRQRATDELSKLGDAITPALRQAMADKSKLEMRRRLQQLLDQTRDWTPERLRDHRAIQALEHMNTRSGREVLQALAEGMPETQRTEEAKAVIQRFRR